MTDVRSFRCGRGMPTFSRSNSVPSGAIHSPFDRFIHSRRNSDFESAYFKLLSPSESVGSSPFSPERNTPRSTAYPERGAGGGGSKTPLNRSWSNHANSERLLTFSNGSSSKADKASMLRRLYSDISMGTPKRAKAHRYIPKSPDRILDMPDIVDNVYNNVLDWSSDNKIAVALSENVYSWNAVTCQCVTAPLRNPTATVMAIAWSPSGNLLAIGTFDGCVKVWNTNKDEVTQIIKDTAGSVDALAWSRDGEFLYTGLSCGCLRQVHLASKQLTHLIDPDHTLGVCVLKVSRDGHHLASGGPKSPLRIWDLADRSLYQRIDAHASCVKAIAWCPWRCDVIASGGDAEDCRIRIWNINSGVMLHEVNTHTQVYCMLWSARHRELVTGGANKNVVLWSFPQLNVVATLRAHHARVLHLAISPDGSTVASCGADELLMLWKCFESPAPIVPIASCPLSCSSPLTRTIR